MRCITVLCMYNVFSLISSKSVNYCGSKMCRNTNTHTFCQYAPGPGTECTGYIPAPLSKDEKARIMARLNRRRNEAAYGRLRGLPSAGNMLKLRWVEELAREAQIWADQCRPPAMPEEQDVCRDLYSSTVGQCVASVVGEAPGLRVESMIDMWYMQSMMYKGNITSYELSPISGGYYGDFGQMMWARAYMVGCGRSRFMKSWQGRMRSVERLVCNIAPRGPIPGRSLWTPAFPASACPPRSVADEILKGLCNFHPDLDETQDVDNSFTLEEHIVLNTVLDFEKNTSLDVHGNFDKTYLTRMAIAAITNRMTTPMYYNSVQKRDIVELIELDELQNDLTKFVLNENDVKIIRNTVNSLNVIQEFDKSTMQYEIKVTKPPKEVKLIGRPKTYNIEDLTNNEADHSKENSHNMDTERAANIVKDPFDEYSFLEVLDENNATSIEMANSTVHEHDEIKTSIIVVTKSIPPDLNDEEMANSATNRMISGNGNLSNEMSFESNAKNGSVDDYLDDPETVRQLQEALDRMEQTMETPTQQTQGKVRRELRDFPPEQYLPEVEHNRMMTSKYYQSPDLEAINKTLERGPMMNMMLKYVPYLKDYESNILNRPSSKSSVVDPHLILFVVFISLV